MIEDRKLYRGKFNISGEVLEEYVRAYSKEQAFRLLCSHLGALHNRTGSSLQKYFLGKAHSYQIEEVEEC